MSRKNKNLRAFLHQNPNPTIKQAWDAAWEGAQKVYHAKRIKALEAMVLRVAKGECKCTFSQRMQGDGCEVCNPERAIDLLPGGE